MSTENTDAAEPLDRPNTSGRARPRTFHIPEGIEYLYCPQCDGVAVQVTIALYTLTGDGLIGDLSLMTHITCKACGRLPRPPR